jgi:hypothetical protein
MGELELFRDALSDDLSEMKDREGVPSPADLLLLEERLKGYHIRGGELEVRLARMGKKSTRFKTRLTRFIEGAKL